MSEAEDQVGQWFYEMNGERKGGVSESEIIALIESGAIAHGNAVWKKGFPEWMKIENTELRKHLDEVSPPPLTGDHVKNTIVWFLAFAPILGLMLEYFVAGMVYSESHYTAEKAASSGEFWFITLALNLALSYWDASSLKKAGANTDKFGAMAWLIPVYLFKRAKALKHSMAYFTVWIVCFALVLIDAA